MGENKQIDLTENQSEVLAILRSRGAGWSAEAAERNWRSGQPAFFDDRNAATKGIIRRIKKGNAESTRHQ